MRGVNMPAWIHRFVLVTCALAALGGIGALVVVLRQTQAEYARVLEQEEATRRRLQEVETKLAEQEQILTRLKEDSTYVEWVIRRRLGLAKSEELVFRFNE